MDRDPQVLFWEAWEFAAKRITSGKRSKDRVRFFLVDGTTKTFDIPPMRDDQMKDAFLEMTLKALVNHPVEALLLSYEAWFVDTEEKIAEVGIDAYLRTHPRPQNHPHRREGVNFYYETADGTMLTALAEIVTVKKNKRELAKLSPMTVATVEGRMSHFFQKARDYEKTHRRIIDEIISRN
jgi:hypothetical protein